MATCGSTAAEPAFLVPSAGRTNEPFDPGGCASSSRGLVEYDQEGAPQLDVAESIESDDDENVDRSR